MKHIFKKEKRSAGPRIVADIVPPAFLVRHGKRIAVSSAVAFAAFALFELGLLFFYGVHYSRAASTQIVITSTASTTWTVPSDWNNASNTIEVIGGGGGGDAGTSGQVGGGGGGGGAYAETVNASLVPGTNVAIHIGAAGGAAAPGGDTYLCNSTSSCTSVTSTAVVVGAQGGTGASGVTNGTGGATANSTGTAKFAGGSGGSASGADGGGAGGGAAGSSAAGNPGGAGSGTTGGTGGQGDGTAGGAGGGGGTGGHTANPGTSGSNGLEWSGAYGSGGGGGGGGGDNFKTSAGGNGATGGTYGAGGGGGGGCSNSGCTAGTGAAGVQGIIVITYTPFVPTLTVSATGTQIASANIPSSGFYVGGAFTMVRDSATATVSQIVVTASGTVNANANLSNLILYYEQAATCATSSIPGTAAQFNSAGVSFNSSEQATATGSFSVGTAQVCIYAKLDVGSGASSGQTLQLTIADPATDVTVDTGNVSPATAVALGGQTTLEVPTVTAGSTGTQFATTTIPKSAFYVGGAFTFSRSAASTTVTQITVTASGTVNANANLSNLKLFYEQQSTCSTTTIPVGVTAFNATGGSFNGSGQSTVTGSMDVATSQVCVYVQVDVGSGANTSDTVEFEIADPATDVTVGSGAVSPATVVAIPGVTTLVAPPSFLIEHDFRVYENVDAVQPVTALAAEDASATDIAQGGVIRLRLNIISSNGPLTTSSQAFKLQYALKDGFALCTNVPSGNFADVGAFTSSTIWRGFNNTSTADGTTIATTLLSTSTVGESYVEENPSPANPNRISTNGVGEWDFVVENNGATSGSAYCFRAVKSDGSVLAQYDNLPEAIVVRPLFEVHYRWRNDDGGE